MLRQNTLRRPSDVLYFLSVQDTLLNMANAQQRIPPCSILNNMKESPKTSLGRLVKHSTFSVTVWGGQCWVPHDTTENWCQERAVYLALLESISIHDGQGEQDRDSIPAADGLTPLAVCFDLMWDTTISMTTMNRDTTSIISKKNRIPFGLEYLTKLQTVVLLIRLSTSLLLVRVSASLYSCAQWLARSSSCKGRNVLYITLEMAEERIERELMPTSSTSHQDIVDIPTNLWGTR